MGYYPSPRASSEETNNSDDSSSEEETNHHPSSFNVYTLAAIATQNYWLKGYTCNFDLQSGALASVAVEVNTNRVQCDKCKRWFGHNEMLQCHLRENTTACSRCGDSNSKIVVCSGITKHILGCEQHKLCYRSLQGNEVLAGSVTWEWSTSRISSHIRNSH
jgi:hypothetical protein